MRIKFEIDINNNVTILSADQDENTIIVKQDGDNKIITVTAPDTTLDLNSLMNDYPEEGIY